MIGIANVALRLSAAVVLLGIMSILVLGLPASGPQVVGDADSGATLVNLDAAEDIRLRGCAAADDPTQVRAAVELATGSDYQKAFPGMGRAPELDDLKAPVAFLVYSEGYPGIVWGDPDSSGGANSTPEPGTVDVCAVLPDGEVILYANVPIKGFVAP
jgi:hypothetical protein